MTSLLPSWPALGQLPSFSRVLLLRVLIQTCTLDICDQAHTLWRVIKLQLWIEELHEKPRSILTKDYINVLMYVFMYVYWYWSNCLRSLKIFFGTINIMRQICQSRIFDIQAPSHRIHYFAGNRPCAARGGARWDARTLIRFGRSIFWFLVQNWDITHGSQFRLWCKTGS